MLKSQTEIRHRAHDTSSSQPGDTLSPGRHGISRVANSNPVVLGPSWGGVPAPLHTAHEQTAAGQRQGEQTAVKGSQLLHKACSTTGAGVGRQPCKCRVHPEVQAHQDQRSGWKSIRMSSFIQ